MLAATISSRNCRLSPRVRTPCWPPCSADATNWSRTAKDDISSTGTASFSTTFWTSSGMRWSYHRLQLPSRWEMPKHAENRSAHGQTHICTQLFTADAAVFRAIERNEKGIEWLWLSRTNTPVVHDRGFAIPFPHSQSTLSNILTGLILGHLLSQLWPRVFYSKVETLNQFVKVYKEAQFYQIQGLIDKLEKYSIVFAIKLEKAKKAQFGDHFDEWKETIIACAQNRSIEKLSSTVKLGLLTNDDHTRLTKERRCIGEHDHCLVVRTPDAGSRGERYECVQKRLNEPDLILSDVTAEDMKVFSRILERELENAGYRCRLWQEVIRCKNFKKYYNIGKEECDFCITEYVVEFQWPQPTT